MNLFSDLIIYWDNLIVYLFWLGYAALYVILWKYSAEIYYWFFSEMVDKDKDKKDG